MRAVAFDAYGDPGVLALRDLPAREPGPGQVSVDVQAAGVNPADWRVRNGDFRRFLKITALPALVTVSTRWARGGRWARSVRDRQEGRDLRQLADWFGQGRLRPVVESVYPLEQAADAHRGSEAGRVRGKLVLAVDV